MNDLTINLDTDKLKRDITNDLEKRAREQITYQIRAYFTSRGNWGQSDGAGTKMINEIIEDYIGSEDFKRYIKQYVEERINESAARAINQLLDSKTRKYIFEAIPEKK